MKAAVCYGRRDIRVEDVPEPQPQEGEVKIAIQWCAICGTDVGEYLHGPQEITEPPVILGHEYSGSVVAVGDGVQGFKRGDRITGLNRRSCGRCGDACKVKGSMAFGQTMALCENTEVVGLTSPGAFAEYLCLPSYLVVKLEDNVSFEEGTAINPLSTAIHAVKRGNLQIGETAVVIGDGTIGQLTLQVCLASGVRAAFLIGEQLFRLKLAKGSGATETFHYGMNHIKRRILGVTGGRQPDVAFDCVGTENSLRRGIDLVSIRGRVILAGIYRTPCPVDFNDLVIREKLLLGVNAQDYDDYCIANALISQKRILVEPLVTKRIDLEDLVEGGINELIGNRENHLRILVRP